MDCRKRAVDILQHAPVTAAATKRGRHMFVLMARWSREVKLSVESDEIVRLLSRHGGIVSVLAGATWRTQDSVISAM